MQGCPRRTEKWNGCSISDAQCPPDMRGETEKLFGQGLMGRVAAAVLNEAECRCEWV